MLNTVRLGYKAASSAGLLPAFGWILLAVATLSLGFGLWAGGEWQKGRHAIERNVELVKQRAADRKAIDELQAAAKKLAQHSVNSALAYDQAMQRIDAIATTLESNLEQNRQFTAKQSDALADLVGLRADLRALRLGDDVLRHWNRSNQGPAGTAPAAAPKPAGKPANAVPPVPARTQQPRARPAGQSRRSDLDRQRLPQPQRIAAGHGRRMDGHGVALVLRRGGSGRPRRVGVPQA